MAVIDSYIIAAGISGDARGRESKDSKTSYRVRWRAVCDSPTDTARTVIEHFRTTSGKPFIGDSYAAGGDSDRNAVCTSISPSLIDKSGGMFDVDVSYEPSDGSGDEAKPSKTDPNKTTNDPRDWRDEIDVSTTQISVPTEVAIFRGFRTADGKVVRNKKLAEGVSHPPCDSTLQPFDPPLEHEVDIEIYRFTKYTDSFFGQDIRKWISSVNSEEITIQKPECNFVTQWGAYTARIKAMPSTLGLTNGIIHWRSSLEVHVNPFGWRRQVVDRGFFIRQAAGDRQLNADGTLGTYLSDSEVPAGSPAIVVLKDAEGYPITTPVLLDGDGLPLQKGKPPVYSIWSQYPEQSFSQIRW